MHAERINASRKYDAALKAERAAGMGSDLVAWEKAEAARIEARDALVAAEMQYPTKQEVARERRAIEMSNRGLRK